MPRVIQIDPLSDPRWDALVESHPFGWLTHTATWAGILLKSFPHLKPFYLALEGESGELQAGLPLMEFRSPLSGNRLVSLPYSTLCDPLVQNGSELQALLSAARSLCRQRGLDFLEIRSARAGELLSTAADLDCRQDYAWHRLDLRKPLGEIKRSFSRLVRRCIQRSEREGLEAKPVASGDFPVIWRLYVQTRWRKGLPTLPPSFVRSWIEELVPTGKSWGCIVTDAGRPVSALLTLAFKKRMSAELLGWDLAVARKSPNHKAYWMAICHAHGRGLEEFDFGRTPIQERPLMEFKNYWGGTCESFTFAYSPPGVASRRSPNGLVRRLGGWVCRSVPRAVLPAVSRVIYRHTG
ncbi:MAG: hypothetical protein Kow00109_05760 [Acidobacteriota bacterium]